MQEENKIHKKARMIFDSTFLRIVHTKVNHLLNLHHLLLLLIRLLNKSFKIKKYDLISGSIVVVSMLAFLIASLVIEL